MNFVVASYNYLPASDPEASCTARFVNMLAAAGHSVTVVTCEWPNEVPDKTVSQMVTEDVRVVRVAQRRFRNPCIKFIDRAFKIRLWMGIGLSDFSRSLRKTLEETVEPILVSRCDPIEALIVAMKCRKYARRWIAHFSDPMPIRIPGRFPRFVSKRIMARCRKAFALADGIFVTCPHAVRWFTDVYGESFTRWMDKVSVCTHVGNPLLKPVDPFRFSCPELLPRSDVRRQGVIVLSHCGYISGWRYLREVRRELSLLSLEMDLVFWIVGRVDEIMKRSFSCCCKDVEGMLCKDHSIVTNVYDESDVCLVLDTKCDMNYSPFLPSKFVFALFADVPIVACAVDDSPMAAIVRKFPGSKIYSANPSVKGEIAAAIKSAVVGGRANYNDREAVRKYFSSDRIVHQYLGYLEHIKVI